MKHRKSIYILITCLFAISFILAGIIFYTRSQELRVVFLDVGEGDAILIEQGSRQILIDGGPNGQALMDKLGRYIPFWDRNIELVIESHPDADHITGLIDVLKNYSVGAVMRTSEAGETQTFKELEGLIQAKKINVIAGERGEKITFADGANMEILNPGPETPMDSKNTNATSLVAKLVEGQNSFLFTGDLPGPQEAALVSAGLDLHARVLKVGHHGSKYSTSADFLGAVKPTDAIISVGKNSYGHPAPEVMERLKGDGINIWRTDEKGDIGYACKNQDSPCSIAN